MDTINGFFAVIKDFFVDMLGDWPGRVAFLIIMAVVVYVAWGPMEGFYKYHSKNAHSFEDIVQLCQEVNNPDRILTEFAEVKLDGLESYPNGFRDSFFDSIVADDFEKAEKFSNKYDPPYNDKTMTANTENKSKELAKSAKAALDQSEKYTFRPEMWGVTYNVMATPGHRYIKVRKIRSTSEGWGTINTTNTWYIRWSKI